MKLLRFICNLLMFVALTVTICLLQVGLYDLTAIQSEDIPEIKLSASDEDDIAYFDNWAFWAEDIKGNLNQPEKYRIRNWASWGWWKKGMGWADRALDTVIAVVKPVVVPVAQVNAVNNYYGYDLNDPNIREYLLMTYETEEALNNALYEVCVVFEKGYGEVYTVGENPVLINEYQYTGELVIEDEIEVEYARWVKRNGRLYNTIWKLSKYNTEVYDKYFVKFISHDKVVDEDGNVQYVNRHIKTAVTVMYYQQIVALILALAFTIKYPIALGQAKVVGKTKKEL